MEDSLRIERPRKQSNCFQKEQLWICVFCPYPSLSKHPPPQPLFHSTPQPTLPVDECPPSATEEDDRPTFGCFRYQKCLWVQKLVWAFADSVGVSRYDGFWLINHLVLRVLKRGFFLAAPDEFNTKKAVAMNSAGIDW